MPASFPRLGLLGALCSIVPLLHASEPATDAALIEKGRYVAQLGDCIACHTGRHSCFFQKLDTKDWVSDEPVLKNPEEIYRHE